MTIRKASAEDIEDIVRIERESFKSPWSDRSFLEELSRNDTETLIAFSETLAAGYCSVRLGIDEAELFKIAVSRDFRRQGVARSLYLAAEHICAINSKTRIFLEVDQINISAIALYASLGFTEVSRRKNYYENRAAIIMIKTLAMNNSRNTKHDGNKKS
jgi:[ribosomal protein S18]-alanine N-acetyltransferase